MSKKNKKVILPSEEQQNRKMNYRIQNILIHEARKPKFAGLTFWELLVQIGVIVNEGTNENPIIKNDLKMDSEDIFNRCCKKCAIRNYGLYK